MRIINERVPWLWDSGSVVQVLEDLGGFCLQLGEGLLLMLNFLTDVAVLVPHCIEFERILHFVLDHYLLLLEVTLQL